MATTRTPEDTAHETGTRRRLTRFVAAPPIVPDAILEGSPEGHAVRRRERVYRRLLLVADVLAMVLAFTVAVVLVGGTTPELTAVVLVPFVATAAKILGLYDRDELLLRKTTIEEAPQLFQLATLTALVAWLLDGAIVDTGFERPEVLTLWLVLFVASVGARRLARDVARAVTAEERILFIGEASAYARLDDKLRAGGVKARLVGRMSLQRTSASPLGRAPGDEDLRELVEWADVHRVVIDPHVLPPGDMLDLVRAAKLVGVHVSLLPGVLDVVGTSVQLDELQGMTLMGLRRFGLSRSSKALKRAFDLLGAGVALVVAAPVMLVCAVLIRLDSPGPVLFRQKRVGRDGREFVIYKFRTMCDDAEERKAELEGLSAELGGMFKVHGDPRVTRVGRLLRRSSLDELPQILNVLQGNMSLIGPRPLIVDEDRKITGYDRRRLHLTPGMTGPWQIVGSGRVPLAEMVKMDYLYVANWSLWRDLMILVRTLAFVAGRRGV